jgi:phage terminase small subunit
MAGKTKKTPAKPPRKQSGAHRKCPKSIEPLPKAPDAVTGQQKLFCDLLLADVELNATAAYQQAYPGASYAGARASASYLLSLPNIRKYLDIRQEDRRKRLEIDQDYVLNNLLEVNERCLQRAPVMTGSGKERKQLVTIVDDPETGETILANVWQFDAAGVCKANELIGRHLKMFTDKIEHSIDPTLEDLLGS